MRLIGVRIRPARFTRSLLCTVLLLGHGLATFGYPLLPRAGSSGGLSCHGRACGCPETVEPRACCCSGHRGDLAGAEPEVRSCCSKKATRSCCAAPAEKAKAEAKPVKGWRWLLAVQAQRCRGEMPFGTLSADPVNPDPESLPSLPSPPPAGLVSCASEAIDVVPADPPSPPPRSV